MLNSENDPNYYSVRQISPGANFLKQHAILYKLLSQKIDIPTPIQMWTTLWMAGPFALLTNLTDSLFLQRKYVLIIFSWFAF